MSRALTSVVAPTSPRCEVIWSATTASVATAAKLADLVVLGRDPLRVPPGSLITIPVERRMAGGRWVFES